MIFYTYSRSAMLGVIFAYILVLVMSLWSLWRFYRMQLISVIIILWLFMWSVGIIYYDRAMAIVGRAGSTQWHSERMVIGFKRVIEHPFGQWLGSAGPAYRHVMKVTDVPHESIVELDKYYIPESWYIQQFIEGWFLSGILFLGIIASIFISLMILNPILGALFAWVSTMNLFLHTFESSTVSLSLFLLVWMFLAYKHDTKK